MLIWFMHYLAMTDSIESISSFVGLPNSYIILSIWFKVDVPGNIAFPVNISPKMHPIDHISTAFVYFDEPNKIYGALYHLVATYSVIIASPLPWFTDAIDRANPKSANLAKQSESRRMLEGLRSLWTRSPECIYFKPFKTLNKGMVTDTWHIFCEHFLGF